MIALSRIRKNENGKEIRPDDKWFVLANKKTELALREKRQHKVSKDVYRHQKVKEALEELFFLKCVYCEIDISRSEWNVEHFRPKGRVKERRGHPGYYWLSYKWENLYPSCVFCNQSRKARPRWGRKEREYGGGKADQFPLADEATRAMKPADDVSKERRLLLDPCEDDPERHLGYEWNGQIYFRENSKKGEESIRIFGLKETRLRDARRKVIDDVCGLVKLKISLKRRGGEELREVEEMINGILQNERNFIGAARFVLENPEMFGLDE